MENEDTTALISENSSESDESIVSVIECSSSALKENSIVDKNGETPKNDEQFENQPNLVNKSVQTIEEMFSSCAWVNKVRDETNHLHEQMINTINFLEHSTSPLEIKSLRRISSNTKDYIIEYENEVQTQKKKFLNILHTMLPSVNKLKCLIPLNGEEHDGKSLQSFKSPTRKEDTPTTTAKPKDTYVNILKTNEESSTSIGQKLDLKTDDIQVCSTPSREIVKYPLESNNYKLIGDVCGIKGVDKILTDKKQTLNSRTPFKLDDDLSESHKKNTSASSVENHDCGSTENEDIPINKKHPLYASKKFHSAEFSSTSKANIEDKKHTHTSYNTQTNFFYRKQNNKSLNFDLTDYISALQKNQEKQPSTQRQLESMKSNSSSTRFDFVDYYSKVISLRTKYDNLKKIKSCRRISETPKAMLIPHRNKAQVNHQPKYQSDVQNRFYKDFEGYFEKLKHCRANVDQVKTKKTSSSNRSVDSPYSESSVAKFHPQQLSSTIKSNKKLTSPRSNGGRDILAEKKEAPPSIGNTFRNLVQRFSPSRFFRNK